MTPIEMMHTAHMMAVRRPGRWRRRRLEYFMTGWPVRSRQRQPAQIQERASKVSRSSLDSVE